MAPGPLKRALLVAGCGVLTVTASACESTEQESAKIAKQEEAAGKGTGPLKLGAPNRAVHVSDVTLVKGGGRMAVVAKLTSTSSRPQTDVPLLLKVTGAGGKVLYTNETAGLEASLQHIGLLKAHQSAWWVDDQVLISQHTTGVKLQAGTGSGTNSGSGAPTLTAVHTTGHGVATVLTAKLLDRGAPAHSTAAVSAVAVKGGRPVAGGREVVEVVHPGATVPVQIFLVGDATGAKLELNAVAAGRKPIEG